MLSLLIWSRVITFSDEDDYPFLIVSTSYFIFISKSFQRTTIIIWLLTEMLIEMYIFEVQILTKKVYRLIVRAKYSMKSHLSNKIITLILSDETYAIHETHCITFSNIYCNAELNLTFQNNKLSINHIMFH